MNINCEGGVGAFNMKTVFYTTSLRWYHFLEISKARVGIHS